MPEEIVRILRCDIEGCHREGQRWTLTQGVVTKDVILCVEEHETTPVSEAFRVGSVRTAPRPSSRRGLTPERLDSLIQPD